MSTIIGMRTLGQRLREERQAAGLSMQALADAAGVTKQAIAQIERGNTSRPEARTLEPIARKLGLRLRWLLDETGTKRSSDPEEPASQAVGIDIPKLSSAIETIEAAEAKARMRLSPIKRAKLIALVYTELSGAVTDANETASMALAAILKTFQETAE